jgi:hypothetical protein
MHFQIIGSKIRKLPAHIGGAISGHKGREPRPATLSRRELRRIIAETIG